jgi:endonuclease-8
MSEGPEVKRTADKLSSVLIGQVIDKIIFRKAGFEEVIQSLVGTSVERIHTHGKNIIIQFSNGIFLRNHMMMWGKWRIYDRKQYDEGKAKSPPRRGKRRIDGRIKNDKRSIYDSSIALITVEETDAEHSSNIKVPNSADNPCDSSTPDDIPGNFIVDHADVRSDRRVRLVILTKDHVAVQFNGPILKFSKSNPFLTDPTLTKLGPDPLKPNFSYDEAKRRYNARLKMKLADLLLDQTFVAGIGNKYKSELLFLCRLNPFIAAERISTEHRDRLIKRIPAILKIGYENAGRTRTLLDGEEQNKWNFRHWVFRRAGRPCWICQTPIKFDANESSRVSFWCPNCQKATPLDNTKKGS